MVEPIATIGASAIVAYLGKDGLQKLLGPTADYLGNGLKDLTAKRIEAIGQIFTSADKKLGDKVNEPGEVPPKVLKVVIDEGSYSNDPLATEYFGGILASSRTEGGRDDRGARLAKMVDGLSTYQLRAHYLLYASIRATFGGKDLPFNMHGRPKMQIFIPMEPFVHAMDFDEGELAQISSLLGHIFFGLHADNLIEGQWRYGSKEHMVELYAQAETGGIVCQPSALGAELFLSAFGKADQPLEEIFNPSLDISIRGVPAGVIDVAPTQT